MAKQHFATLSPSTFQEHATLVVEQGMFCNVYDLVKERWAF